VATTTQETIHIGPLAIRFLVEGSSSGGSVALFEFDVPPGARVPGAHSHDAYDETIYGLEGTLTWTIDDTRIQVAKGEAVHIPRGAVHHFANETAADASALAVVTPGAIGPDYFREVGALLGAGGPPDPTAVAEVMLRHGLTPAP
jgi:quercetin dioxygenase-like cupin family protein